jgi:hypothetical protein
VAERRAAAPRSPRHPEGVPMHIRAVMRSCAILSLGFMYRIGRDMPCTFHLRKSSRYVKTEPSGLPGLYGIIKRGASRMPNSRWFGSLIE